MGTQTSSGGTQTTQVNPPSYQLPYLQKGLAGAYDQYQSGGPQQYAGNTVTPFAPQTEQALQGITDRATNGSPVIQAGQGLVTDTLNGKYLDPNSNPYLKSTFDQAAQASQASGEAQFAGTGRNVQAGAPQRNDLLSSLATQIYGGNYQQERQNQLGALNYASPLAEADYRDLSALQGVGQTVEDKTGQIIADQQGRWNYDQQQPGNTLDDFLRRVSGNLGQTSSTQLPDVYRNRTAGGLGGAAAGAQIGNTYGGNGGIYGALLGGLLGAYGGG